MVLRKRTWRILTENKGRYIGILILIILGSFTFVATSGLAVNLGSLVGGFASEHLQEDVSFSTNHPLADISMLEEKSGAWIDSYRFYDVELYYGQPLQLISPSTRVNLPAVTSGRALDEPGDLLLNPGFLALHNLAIGDQVEIYEQTFTIVGTMALPHYVYPIRFVHDVLPPSGFGIGLISEADFKLFPDATQVYTVRFTERKNLTTQTMALHRLLREEGYSLVGWVDAENNRRIQMPWASITGAEAVGLPMSSVMFLLTCLIVGVMIWRMVKADSVVIGMMYAQGYRRKELLRHYLALPVLLAVIGGLLGVLLALPFIRPAVHMMVLYYNVPLSGISLSLHHAIIGVLMPVTFIGLAAFFVIRKELKKTAGELMKGDRGAAKVNILERSVNLSRFSFSTKFQIREQIRSIPRLMFLLFGVTAASFLMLVGFTINHSMNTVLGGGTDEMFNFSIEYSFNTIQHGEAPEGAEPFNAINVFPEGRETAQFYVMGILPDSDAIIPRDASGNLLHRNQVTITFPLANRLNLRSGDTITFTNRMDGQTYSLVIDSVAQTYTGQFIFMPIVEFNYMIGMPPDSHSGLLATHELDIDPRLLAGLMDLREAGDAMDDFAGAMMAMIVAVTVMAGLIGMVIIFLVASLMIDESKKSISLLKVFGYRNREVSKLILNSSTWVVIAGFLLGIPVMLLTMSALYDFLGEMINLVLPMLLSPLHVLISFLLIMAVYLLTRKFCGRKLAKVSMSEVLKGGAE